MYVYLLLEFNGSLEHTLNAKCESLACRCVLQYRQEIYNNNV